MRKSKFSQQQKLDILAEHDAGMSVADLCRKHQVSPATFYKWKKDKAIDEDDTLRRLEAENKRLKKMYTDLSIDHDILKQGYSMAKKFAAQDAKKK